MRYIKEQTPEICLAAVQQNGRVLDLVEEQTKEVCLAAVNQTQDAIQCIRDPEMRKQVEEILKQGSASAMSIF